MNKENSVESLNPVSYAPFYSYRSGSAVCESLPLSEIAQRAGTPVYVYSGASITQAYRRARRAFRGLPLSICYAVKANSNLAVLRLLARLGSSFDVVSGGELHRLRTIGVPGQRIVFSGVGKTREEIREALRSRILLFHVESEAELDVLAREAAIQGRPAPASIRINPDVSAGAHPHIATGHHDHKFGVDWPLARHLYFRHRNSLWIEWKGISAHIGSQILSLAPFRLMASRLASHFRELSRAGIGLKYLDCGGGVGIRYTNEKPVAFELYASALGKALGRLGAHLLIEPGRSLVGPAGVLLTRVLYVKSSLGRKVVVVDAAMNDLIRPALYGASHPITPVVRPPHASESFRADVVGPICESGDSFLRDWSMPEVKTGDLLIIWSAGAYGFVESSNYNSRPRAPEVIVSGRSFHVVRRRESLSDLIRGERSA